jgi:VanZ family protein
VKRRAPSWLPVVLTILWIGFIWGHSMVPADLSAQESGWALEALRRVFALLHLPEILTDHVVRKMAHFTEYLILGVLGTNALRPWADSARRLGTALVGVMVPLVDETIQLFVSGRSGQISDVWLDVAGFSCGFLVVLFVYLVRQNGQKCRR